MYNAKNILSFCAKVRRLSDFGALKVAASVVCLSLTSGEVITLCVEVSRLVFSLASINDALNQVGIHPHDVVALYDGKSRVWRVTFFTCKAGTASKLKSFFKL